LELISIAETLKATNKNNRTNRRFMMDFLKFQPVSIRTSKLGVLMWVNYKNVH
jgi:hypothetical protein